MARYIDVDALWKNVSGNIDDCADFLEIIERQPVIAIDSESDRTINASDLQEWIMEIFPDWCEGAVRVIYDHIDDMPTIDHNADDSKKVSISRGHENDLIDRGQAIEAMARRCDFCEKDKMIAIATLQCLPSVQPDNQINLCDSCDYSYPDCPIENDDVIFGNGIGNDNICACNKYKPSAQPEQRELSGWVCPVCGRGLSPFTSVCPCNNGKGWEITC